MQDYLTNRKQIAKYNQIRLTEMAITCGVPLDMPVTSPIAEYTADRATKGLLPTSV